jgi:hypothetical protein
MLDILMIGLIVLLAASLYGLAQWSEGTITKKSGDQS